MTQNQLHYREVAFRDTVTGKVIVTRSTVETSKTLLHGGELLPLVDLDVSADSHPFYTGVRRIPAQASRVARFNSRSAKVASSPLAGVECHQSILIPWAH